MPLVQLVERGFPKPNVVSSSLTGHGISKCVKLRLKIFIKVFIKSLLLPMLRLLCIACFVLRKRIAFAFSARGTRCKLKQCTSCITVGYAPMQYRRKLIICLQNKRMRFALFR